MIPEQTKNEIIEAAIIEDVIGEFIPLKKRGANLLGLCPFHNEKTPSFTVSPAKGIYKCFGCGKSGNAISFIMEHEHFNFPEALKYLADKYNIEIEEKEYTDEQKQAANERESLYIVSKFAAEYFKKQLLNSDEGRAIGLSYFLERGFREDIINKFQLGYNPDQWTAFTDAAEKEGHNITYLDKTGLTIVKDTKKFDRFKGRVIFPIHNLSGRVLGFGGRTLKSGDKKIAKYINSPESDIYNKSNVLYGIYFAKKSIVEQNNCYLVEGYTDVISLHQAGVENVVSSSGTSLTEGQIRLIKRFSPNVTILYDGDAAGLKASFRGIDMILKEGMNVKVVLFPDGEDPDSYAKSHPSEEIQKYITENAQDFIRFKTSILIKEVGEDPLKRAELIKEIVQSIAVIPDHIKRSIYTQDCSTLLNIPEQAIITETNKILQKNYSKKLRQNLPQDEEPHTSLKQLEKPSITSDIPHREFEIIRLLMAYGNKEIEVSVFDEKTEKETTQTFSIAFYITRIISQDEITFETKLYQEIFNFYINQLKQDKIPLHQDLINNDNEEISKLAITIFSEKYQLSPNWVKYKINVSKEEDSLSNAIPKAIYEFKLTKVNSFIQQKEDELKDASEENYELFLTEINNLTMLKKQLAYEKLGKVIIK